MMFLRLLLLQLLLIACLAWGTDYRDTAAWVYRERDAAPDKPADVFFVAPSCSTDPARDNIDTQDPETREKFKWCVDLEKGCYDTAARFFAPYYRQKTLPHYASPMGTYRAYCDVRAAFLEYLEHDNGGRPIVLVGFSQGSEMLLALMKELFARPELQERLVAAYLLGWHISPGEVEQFPQLRAAKGEEDTGVIVCWNTEETGTQDSVFVTAGTRSICINPLNWCTDATPAPAESNAGARFTLLGEDAPLLPGYCGAVINTARGTLNPTFTVHTPGLERGMLFGPGIYHLFEYLFWYENLRRNVVARIRAYTAGHALSPEGAPDDEPRAGENADAAP